MRGRTRRQYLLTVGAAVVGAGCLSGGSNQQPANESDPIFGDETTTDPGDATTDPGETTAGPDSANRGAPMFNYDAANTGSAPYQTGPEPPVTEEWQFETATNSRITSPAVLDGTAYIGTRGQTLYAVNVADGTERWSYDVEATYGEIRETPAISGDSVLFGDNGSGLYSVSTADGSQHWENSSASLYVAPPAVYDGTLYAAPGYSVYAINISDGSEHWRQEMPGDAEIYGLAVSNGYVFIGQNNGRLTAFNATDGAEQWTVAEDLEAISALTVANGTVFAATQNTSGPDVHAFSIDSGSRQWSRDVSGDGWGILKSVAVTNETLYVPTNGAQLVAVSTEDGAEKWAKDSGAVVAPTVVNDTVYIDRYTEGQGNNLIARDTGDGSQQWLYQMEANLATSPVVVDGTVLVGDSEGTLHAINSGE